MYVGPTLISPVNFTSSSRMCYYSVKYYYITMNHRLSYNHYYFVDYFYSLHRHNMSNPCHVGYCRHTARFVRMLLLCCYDDDCGDRCPLNHPRWWRRSKRRMLVSRSSRSSTTTGQIHPRRAEDAKKVISQHDYFMPTLLLLLLPPLTPMKPLRTTQEITVEGYEVLSSLCNHDIEQWTSPSTRMV